MNYNDKKLIYARTIVCLVQLQIRSVFVIITLIFVVFRNSVLIMHYRISPLLLREDWVDMMYDLSNYSICNQKPCNSKKYGNCVTGLKWIFVTIP